VCQFLEQVRRGLCVGGGSRGGAQPGVGAGGAEVEAKDGGGAEDADRVARGSQDG
jgi:hypothetical protein